MNALTRINANTKVKYDVMNALEAEIEARDMDLQQQIDVLSKPTFINYSDIDNIHETGLYSFLGTGVDGFGVGYLYLLNVYGGTPSRFKLSTTQIITCVYNHAADNRMLYRNYYTVGGWSGWLQLSTTSNSFMSYGYYNGDMNALITQGCYLCGNQTTITNRPNTTAWGTVNVFAGGTGSYIQEWVSADNVNKWYRHFSGTLWGDWQQVATTNLNEKVYTDAELLNGWTIVSGGTGVYLQKVGREVKLQAMITNTTQPTDLYILNIPSGFMPMKNVYFTVHNQKGEGATIGGGYVNANGYCYFSGGVPTQYASNLEFHASWFTR